MPVTGAFVTAKFLRTIHKHSSRTIVGMQPQNCIHQLFDEITDFEMEYSINYVILTMLMESFLHAWAYIREPHHRAARPQLNPEQ